MTKKVVSFLRTKSVTPSVAGPGEINPSDATDYAYARYTLHGQK